MFWGADHSQYCNYMFMFQLLQEMSLLKDAIAERDKTIQGLETENNLLKVKENEVGLFSVYKITIICHIHAVWMVLSSLYPRPNVTVTAPKNIDLPIS